MTRCAQSRTCKFLGVTIAVLALGLATAVPQGISPASDYMYKKDYAEFENIKKEADLQKRADLISAFVKEKPFSRMIFYAASEYVQCLKPHIDSKNWAKVAAMEESFMALLPSDAKVKAAQVPEPGLGQYNKELGKARQTMHQAILSAYFQSNNLAKAAEIGEKLYAAAPDKNMAATLAQIYLSMKNYDKYLVYGEKILAQFPMEQAASTAVAMVQIYSQKQNTPKAMEILTKLAAAFPDKTPPGLKPEDWAVQRSVLLSQEAAAAYGKKDYTAAIALYEKVIKAAPKADDAPYYYIAMSKWNSKDQEGAIEFFAKAVVLGKSRAAKAREYMEQLYKAAHNDSLDGLDQVLAKAKSELGV